MDGYRPIRARRWFLRLAANRLQRQPQPLQSPLPSRRNPDGGFSFFRSHLRGLQRQLQPLPSPLPSRFNPDGGFSFFRAKERKSPRKKERKPGATANVKRLFTRVAKDPQPLETARVWAFRFAYSKAVVSLILPEGRPCRRPKRQPRLASGYRLDPTDS